MNTQQVVLTGAQSRYGKPFLINAWPVPRVLILQSDKRESDRRGREGGGRKGNREGLDGRKEKQGIKGRQTSMGENKLMQEGGSAVPSRGAC